MRTMETPKILKSLRIGNDSIEQYDLVEISLERIRFAYEVAKQRELGPLYVCFSGGKDSVVLAMLCEEAHRRWGVEYELNYNVTGIDPPELIHFIQKHYPELVWQHPEKTIWKLIEEKGIPPTRITRYCCSELKEGGGEGRMCLTGVRWAESVKRRGRRPYEVKGSNTNQRILFNDNDEGRREFEHCMMKRALICNPIVDWSTDQVWAFIKANNRPYCCLYDQGFERIGCIGCPMAKTREREIEFQRWPGFKKLYIRAFDRMLKQIDNAATWKSGEDVFNWWVYGEQNQKLKEQIRIWDDELEGGVR